MTVRHEETVTSLSTTPRRQRREEGNCRLAAHIIRMFYQHYSIGHFRSAHVIAVTDCRHLALSLHFKLRCRLLCLLYRAAGRELVQFLAIIRSYSPASRRGKCVDGTGPCGEHRFHDTTLHHYTVNTQHTHSITIM